MFISKLKNRDVVARDNKPSLSLSLCEVFSSSVEIKTAHRIQAQRSKDGETSSRECRQ